MSEGTERPSKWIPMKNEVDLAVLGKLLEELNEAGAIGARCVIQGMDGVNPEDHVINRDALEKELADVQAMIDLAVERFKLDTHYMSDRRARKVRMKRAWHAMLEDSP